MQRGLLANVLNIPPLVFRFQYNPEILQEKKRYKYQQANAFGKWVFDQTQAASGTLGKLTGIWEDIKEIGPLLTATKPYEAMEGEPRKFSLEFKLDATEPGPMDTDDHFGGSIEPDLAVLRSFMYPSYDAIDLISWIANGAAGTGWTPPCWNSPPQCALIYGPFSFDCVMEDLDIKITEFAADLSPAKADVKVSLAEQTHSATPITDFIIRNVGAARALGRDGIGVDILRATPLVSPILASFTDVFE